ncbi:EF-P lysine aminoacylase EpmA [Halomonas sp. HNIBRBA4712]|uniref:EF-P lysine aminoacylase EpmA n=1 Tax=Halomonas sp. HNIBRBA4712 TaxID=3373087 RepID=UPI0037460C8E
MALEWRPSADIDTLKARARLFAQVRAFFAERGVLEVDTPVLGQGGSTDVHLASLSTHAQIGAESRTLWLQTSPEFHMKRLLAAGSGPIFQLARSFRDGEVSARHNVEFTMLEWYRLGFTLVDLIEESAALIKALLCAPDLPLERYSYRALFKHHLGLDPFTAPLDELRRLAEKHGAMPAGHLAEEPRDTCLDLLMSVVIEPTLGRGEISAVVDYPASQAALAKRHRDEEGEWVASRFELYIDGMELANGYDELVDAAEQRARFIEDNAERERLGLAPVAIDERLLAALEHGMPEGAGVALGIDRLIQLALGKARLEEVLAFATPRC